MMQGIQTSAPSFLLMSPLGSSAERKLTRKIYQGLVDRLSYCEYSNTYRLAVIEVIGIHTNLWKL